MAKTFLAFFLFVAWGQLAARGLAAQTSDSSSPSGSSLPAFSINALHPSFLDNDHDNDDDDKKKPTTAAAGGNGPSSRYFFGLLDSRSSYGNDFFHDPFLGPEFDSEKQIELDYQHGEKRGLVTDEVDAGFQWQVVGNLMVAVEFGYDWQHASAALGGPDGDDGPGSFHGFESVDLAIYHPVFQFVSPDDFFDYTAAIRVDFAIPTRTRASSKDLQLTPYLGQLLRLGDHVSLEAWTGGLFTLAPNQGDPLLYGVSLGYEIPHDQLPLPLTEKVVPIVEINGEAPFSRRRQESLFGVAGFDWHLRSIGPVGPHIEVGYQFPLDQGAADRLRWGVVAQMFFEF